MKGSGNSCSRESLQLNNIGSLPYQKINFKATRVSRSIDNYIIYSHEKGKWSIKPDRYEAPEGYINIHIKNNVAIGGGARKSFPTRKEAYEWFKKLCLEEGLKVPSEKVITNNYYICSQNHSFSIHKIKKNEWNMKLFAPETLDSSVKAEFNFYFKNIIFTSFKEARLALEQWLNSNPKLLQK